MTPTRLENALNRWEYWLREASFALSRKEWHSTVARLERSYGAAQEADNEVLARASLVLISAVLEVGGYQIQPLPRNPQSEVPARPPASRMSAAGGSGLKDPGVGNDVSQGYSAFKAKFSQRRND